MKLLLSIALCIACCAVFTEAFLFNGKFVDGCNPDPCKNKGVCKLLQNQPNGNKNLSSCACPDGYHGKLCDLKTGCSSKPCKHGSCTNQPTDLSEYSCKCDSLYVGKNCDTKDGCADKEECMFGSCSLDAKLKPVCNCDPGWNGTKHCDKQNCEIQDFSGKNFESKPKVLHDLSIKKMLHDLDAMAKLCSVRIAPVRSFSLQADKTKTFDIDAPFYAGRALEFTLNDPKGKPLCDAVCLGKRPQSLKEANCLLNGLDAIGWQVSKLQPNVIHDGLYLKRGGDYITIKEAHQVGCAPKLDKKQMAAAKELRDKNAPRTPANTPSSPSGAGSIGGLFGSGGSKKFVDGCNPSPCENGGTCKLNSVDKSRSSCVCSGNFHGVRCEGKTGCSSNPCKKGNCINDRVDPSKYVCKCDNGQVGDNCDTKDPCLSKNPCVHGTCHVSPKLNAICFCELGWSGAKCDTKGCIIEQFKGKQFEAKPKVFIDPGLNKKFHDLDALAKICNVRIAPQRSFSKQITKDNKYGDVTQDAFFAGRALQLYVYDDKGKLLCNDICLGKTPIPQPGAKCLFDGLDAIGLKYSILSPGVIHDGSHLTRSTEFTTFKESQQIGCAEKDF